MSKAKPNKVPVQQVAPAQPVAAPVPEVTPVVGTATETVSPAVSEAAPKVATKSVAPKAVVTKAKPAKAEVAAVVATPAPVVEPAKTVKAKKPKLVRDSFTFPESDYALIGGLKLRALSQGVEFKKSEILRAGLVALQALSDADLLKVLATVERIKTGRPAKK